MTSPELSQECQGADQGAVDEMVKYGITRSSVDYFHYKGFRYTNLEDALAQARRQQSDRSPDGQGRSNAR